MASISSSRSLVRPASKVSFRVPSEFDLFYQLIYMSAVASAGIARNHIFRLAAQLVRPPADYFRRIHLLCEKLGYNYPAACNLIGQRARSETMKTLLLRFADALSSGHPEVEFLAQEAQIQGNAYEKEYDRNLGSLSRWTDAYGAVVVSATLIIIVNLTSTMIYDLGVGMSAGLVITAILASAGGAWVISRAAPCETEVAFSAEGPIAQRMTLSLVKVTPPTVFVVCLVMALLRVALGWLLAVAGLLLLPLGIFSLRACVEIEKKDREIGPFLRSFGAVAASTGTTLASALTQLDPSSFPNLQSDLKRLGWRFQAAVSPALCWKQFSVETGSRLINDTIAVFHDAIKLGGDTAMVGSLCSQFATTEVMLRARRRGISATFSNLTIVMHGTVSGLMIIILEVIRKFTDLIAAASTTQADEAVQSMRLPMLTFGSPLLGLMVTLTYAMVVILAVVNTFAITAADGGHVLKGSFYLSILLMLSGACIIVMPPLVQSILQVG